MLELYFNDSKAGWFLRHLFQVGQEMQLTLLHTNLFLFSFSFPFFP